MASLLIGKNADLACKCTVFGHIREQESLLKLFTIPPIIAYLCIAYFYNPEYFARAREDCFKTSEDKMTITNIKMVGWGKHRIYMNN